MTRSIWLTPAPAVVSHRLSSATVVVTAEFLARGIHDERACGARHDAALGTDASAHVSIVLAGRWFLPRNGRSQESAQNANDTRARLRTWRLRLLRVGIELAGIG